MDLRKCAVGAWLTSKIEERSQRTKGRQGWEGEGTFENLIANESDVKIHHP